jgi:subtilisin family serine protease
VADPPRPEWSRDSAVLRLPESEPLAALAQEDAWRTSRGRGVRVAVVDSGIEHDHPLLEGSVDADAGVEVVVEPDGEVRLTRGPHADAYGHGTACAGIIHSIAPEARITSVRVLGPVSGGRAAAFLRGLAWAVDEGYDVVNLSLGTTKADWALPFYELCDRAYFAGTFIVAAANNVARPSFPSLFASVASVACHLGSDPLRFHVNPSPPTEFLARGVDVEVPWKGGGTMTMTGNSFAAPHLSGLAALVRAAHPRLRPFQVKALLWAAAANVREAPRPAGRFSATLRRSTVALSADRLRLPPVSGR